MTVLGVEFYAMITKGAAIILSCIMLKKNSIVNSIDCPRKMPRKRRGRRWIFVRCRGRPWIFFLPCPSLAITTWHYGMIGSAASHLRVITIHDSQNWNGKAIGRVHDLYIATTHKERKTCFFPYITLLDEKSGPLANEVIAVRINGVSHQSEHYWG